MSLCVIIPTCNRVRELRRTLAGLAEQRVKPARVIVIDDGSPDAVLREMEAFCRTLALPVSLLNNAPKKGPAAARNAGISQAREASVLFINDDTRPASPTFIEQHLRFAERHPDSMALGKLAWAPETPNPMLFGRWMKRATFDVGYDGLQSGDVLPFSKFCTANVLVPRDFLRECLFDEGFPFAAYEDIELGYRLARQGRQLRYHPDASVYHDHEYTPEMVIRRQQAAGASLAYLLRIHPELASMYRPRVSRLNSAILSLLVNSPFISCCSADLQLYLRQLAAKYRAFWQMASEHVMIAAQA